MSGNTKLAAFVATVASRLIAPPIPMPDKPPPTMRLIQFPTDDHERKFKRLLSKVPLNARLFTEDDGRRVMAVRPKNVPHLLEAANKAGKPHPETFDRIIRALNHNPVLFIRFEHKHTGE